jgi:lipopolysaccharide export LptBFGC system permease protein LptF
LRPLVVGNAVLTTKLVAPHDHWQLALSYYGRLAVAFEPIVFAGFALLVGAVPGRKRIALVVGVGCAYIVYFFLIDSEILRPLSPMVVAWLPNAAVGLLSMLIGWSSSRRVVAA